MATHSQAVAKDARRSGGSAKPVMHVDPIIAGAFVTAFFAIQAWTLSEVVKMKTTVAVLTATCQLCSKNKTSNI